MYFSHIFRQPKKSGIPKRILTMDEGGLTKNSSVTNKIEKPIYHKTNIPKRVPLENLTNKSKNIIEDQNIAKFPIEASRLSLTWMTYSLKKSQDQFISLRNIWSDKPVRVSLYIREDKYKSFSFNQSLVECDCR